MLPYETELAVQFLQKAVQVPRPCQSRASRENLQFLTQQAYRPGLFAGVFSSSAKAFGLQWEATMALDKGEVPYLPRHTKVRYAHALLARAVSEALVHHWTLARRFLLLFQQYRPFLIE